MTIKQNIKNEFEAITKNGSKAKLEKKSFIDLCVDRKYDISRPRKNSIRIGSSNGLLKEEF